MLFEERSRRAGWIRIDFIGNQKKRPEGCFQTLKLLEINLRDAACMLFLIKSNINFLICCPSTALLEACPEPVEGNIRRSAQDEDIGTISPVGVERHVQWTCLLAGALGNSIRPRGMM